MKVTEKVLYHIHRNNFHSGHWAVGNCINTPEHGYNYFFEGIISKPHRKVSINLAEHDLIKYLGDHIDEFYKFNSRPLDVADLNEDLLDNLNDFNSHTLSLLDNSFEALLYARKVLRETIFENVRAAGYSALPSRQKCFWLCDLEDVDFWWNDFNGTDNKSIFKVCVTGNIFKANGSHIELDIFKLSDFTDSAESYWKGEPKVSKPVQNELLFEGTIKILAQYEDPTHL